MVDPWTVGVVGGTLAYTFRQQVDRILGPSSDYLGERLRDLFKSRQQNIENIIKSTEEVLGDKIDQPGAINPRIIERLVNSGSYIEDDLVQRYFAGVMAASRTPTGNDDRGLYLLDLIIKMSNTDLKAHYILYSKLREKYLGTSLSIFKVDDRHRLSHTMSVNRFFSEFRRYYKDTFDEVVVLTEFIPRLLKEELLNDCFFGPRGFCIERKAALFAKKSVDEKTTRAGMVSGILRATDLSLGEFGFGMEPDEKSGVLGEDLYIVYTPSPLGAQLFLWVHGEGNRLANEIFNPSLRFREISFT